MQVAAVPDDPEAVPEAASDVDDIKWAAVSSLRQHKGNTCCDCLPFHAAQCKYHPNAWQYLTSAHQEKPNCAFDNVAACCPVQTR